MNNKKNVLMFGNKKQMLGINRLLTTGICTIVTGVVMLIIGGRRFYKSVDAISCDDPKSCVIDDMHNDLVSNIAKRKTES